MIYAGHEERMDGGKRSKTAKIELNRSAERKGHDWDGRIAWGGTWV